jgi:hypothetical protein
MTACRRTTYSAGDARALAARARTPPRWRTLERMYPWLHVVLRAPWVSWGPRKALGVLVMSTCVGRAIRECVRFSRSRADRDPTH